jgi:DNA modification methylase
MIKPYFSTKLGQLFNGDCLRVLKEMSDGSIQCVVTSPPYFGLRDYGVAGQTGLGETISEYVDKMVVVFREVRRVLKDDGVLWLTLGDSYSNDDKWGGASGGKHARGLHGTGLTRRKKETGLAFKNLIGIPWRVALALQADGWILRQDIIWSKLNAMPESVADRCTRAHENIFMFSKVKRYFYNNDAIKEPCIYNEIKHKHSSRRRGYFRQHAGLNTRWVLTDKAEHCSGMRNKRSVWHIATQPFRGAHFAVFPEAIPLLCISAGNKKDGVVLDPFMGAGTVALVAEKKNMSWMGIELNKEYCGIVENRIKQESKQGKLELGK